MLAYSLQNSYYVLGSSALAATLTTSYSGNISSAINTALMSQMALFFEYTTGSGGAGNSFQLKIEGSPDPITATPTYFQENYEGVSGGTDTLTAGERSFTGAASATTYRGYFFVPPAFPVARISAKETVVGGSAGTLKLRIILSGN